MSNTVFPFVTLRPYFHPEHHETTQQGLNNGNSLRRSELGTYGQYRVRFKTRLPYGSETVETWNAFLRTTRGATESFLFKERKVQLFYKQTLEAVGTGDGSTVAFALDMKHVDASTLLVYKAGVLQEITTHYTFGGNNTAPLVTFVSPPTGGQAITATYEYYMPVSFAADPPGGEYLGGDSVFGDIELELVETAPGAHRV